MYLLRIDFLQKRLVLIFTLTYFYAMLLRKGLVWSMVLLLTVQALSLGLFSLFFVQFNAAFTQRYCINVEIPIELCNGRCHFIRTAIHFEQASPAQQQTKESVVVLSTLCYTTPRRPSLLIPKIDDAMARIFSAPILNDQESKAPHWRPPRR